MNPSIVQLLEDIQQAALQASLASITADPKRSLRCLQVYEAGRQLQLKATSPCQHAARVDAAVTAAPAEPEPAPAEQVPAKPKTAAQKKGKAVEAEKPAEPAAEEPAADLPADSPGYPALDLKALSALEVPEMRQAGKEWWMGTIDQLTTADSAKGDQLRLEMRAEIGKHKEGSVSIKDIPDDQVLTFWGIVKKLASKYTA